MRPVVFLPFLVLLLLPGSPGSLPFPGTTEITGHVRDARGPVAGARVRIQGSSGEPVATDADGFFRLVVTRPEPQRVTAAKRGYFIGGAPTGQAPLVLTLQPLPVEDCERYAWVDPTPDPRQPHNCGNCHGEIYREWAASGHARSAVNGRFRNLFDGTDHQGRAKVGWSLLADHPDGAGVCTACHAPTVTTFSDPAFADLRQVRGVARHGVHCDYCHKVADAVGDTGGLTHGRFGLELLRPREGQLFFGPLDDVDRGEDAFSGLYRQSRYCASCHEGVVFGVHVYSTYSEWLDSPVRRQGKQCQTCHMAPTARMTNVAPGHGGIERDPHTLGNHRFLAGSPGEMLRQALKVSVQFDRTAAGLRATVEVNADAVGHAVPTGFVDRNLVLLVEGQNAGGEMLPLATGPVLPAVAGPEVAAKPGRLYAKLLRDFDGRSPVPFWRARPEATDTRLVPGKLERVDFSFPSQVEQLRVRLLHRRFWPEVARQKGWADNEIVVWDEIFRTSTE
jgi:hypothetical protein